MLPNQTIHYVGIALLMNLYSYTGTKYNAYCMSNLCISSESNYPCLCLYVGLQNLCQEQIISSYSKYHKHIAVPSISSRTNQHNVTSPIRENRPVWPVFNCHLLLAISLCYSQFPSCDNIEISLQVKVINVHLKSNLVCFMCYKDFVKWYQIPRNECWSIYFNRCWYIYIYITF